MSELTDMLYSAAEGAIDDMVLYELAADEIVRLQGAFADTHGGKCWFFRRANQDRIVKKGACEDCQEVYGPPSSEEDEG